MLSRKKVLVVILAVFLLAGTPSLRAYWVEDGVAVCDLAGSQVNAKLASDGEDGVFIVWRDNRGSGSDIYMQRLDPMGNEMWTADGIAICADASEQIYPEITTDGTGGAIVCWQDWRNGYDDIYAQRVDADGNALWTANGVAVCNAAYAQDNLCIAADGNGGAIMAWVDQRNGERDIFVQKIDAAGAALWTSDGVAICTATLDQYYPEIATDGLGGAFITWQDERSGTLDIYAQKIGADGAVDFTADGIAICSAAEDQENPMIVPDGGGGAIITWSDDRISTQSDIYAQRINYQGTIQWTTNGVIICDATLRQWDPALIEDGYHGAIITWSDFRANTQCDIYAQRIDAGGVVEWAANGVPVSTAYGYAYDPKIAPDGRDGAIIAWRDRRGSYYDIYAQRIDGTGAVQWTADGEPLSTTIGISEQAMIVSDGSGGAYVSFIHYNGTDYDVYAQRIERNGCWGYPAPYNLAVRDIPGDEGGYVNLAWDASRLDPWPEQAITEYSVWRAIDPAAALSMVASGAGILLDAAVDGFEKDASVIRLEQTEAGDIYWKLVSRMDACYLESYSEVVPTLFDSTASSWEYHYFQVIAHTDDPLVCWVSAPDSGYSVDNLSPEVPLGLACEQSFTPAGALLTWDPNGEDDLAGYYVYRGTSETFEPGPETFLTSTSDTLAFDDEWSWSVDYWYKVAAVDIHGNESGFALIGPDQVTGDDPGALPDATFLSQNWPNPFNPSTTISFGLREKGHVSLRIYDAAGRLVVSLIDEDMPGGQYETAWDGTDGKGASLASGIYFYRLVTGDFVRTKKMVLLR